LLAVCLQVLKVRKAKSTQSFANIAFFSTQALQTLRKTFANFAVKKTS